MKKILAMIMALLMLAAFAACGQQKNESESPAATTEAPAAQADWQKASPVYAAFLAQFDKIDFAHAADLNGDGYPEVIAATEENHANPFILTYTEKGGLSVLYPNCISSQGAQFFVSEDNGFYYRVDGHTTGTAQEHAAYLYSVDETGFVLKNSLFGDVWPEDVDHSSNDAVEEMDEKYDRLFDEKLIKALGDKTFQALSEWKQPEDFDAYLNEALHIDLAAARADYAAAEKTLRQAVTDAAGKAPNSVFVSDYDRSGTYEAFAFVADDKQEFDGFVTGSLWFANAQGKADRIMEEADETEDTQVLSCTYHDYFQAAIVAASSLPSSVWEVKGDACKQLDVFDIDKTSLEFVQRAGTIWLPSDTLISSLSAFDSEFSDETVDEKGNPIGVGHTHKPYYFYDTPEGIREYGGVEVQREELEKIAGGKELLDRLEKAGKTVKNIFYRENGVVNISVYEQEEGVQLYENVNAVLTENQLRLLNYDFCESSDLEECLDGGFYSAAAAPDVATYPKSMK